MYLANSFKLVILTWCFTVFWFSTELYAQERLDFSYCDDSELDIQVEQDLLDALFENYSTTVRPKEATKDVYHLEDEPETVYLQTGVNYMWDIDQQGLQYRVSGIVWRRWIDCRLSFKSKERGGTFDVIPVGFSTGRRVWIPRVHVENAREDVDEHVSSFFLHANGEVMLRETFNVMPGCSMDFVHLPFDNHACNFVFESSEYTSEHVVLRLEAETDPEQKPVVLYRPVTNSHWSIDEWDASESEKTYNNGQTDLTYSRMEVSFTLSRRSYWYILNAVVPSNLYWLVSYLGFYIDYAAVPARAAVHLLPVLILVNQHNMVVRTLPPISYHTWLTDYILAILLMVVIHLVMFGALEFSKAKLAKIEKEKKKDLHPSTAPVPTTPKSTALLRSITHLARLDADFEMKMYLDASNLDHYARMTALMVFVLFNIIWIPLGYTDAL